MEIFLYLNLQKYFENWEFAIHTQLIGQPVIQLSISRLEDYIRGFIVIYFQKVKHHLHL